MDISFEGLFIESPTVFAPGVSLHVRLTTRDGVDILLKGTVRWAKKYAMRYSSRLRSGMGLFIDDFHQGGELYRSLCPREERLCCSPQPDEE